MTQLPYIYILASAAAVFLFAFEIARIVLRAKASLAVLETPGADAGGADSSMGLLPEDRFRIKMLVAGILGGAFCALALTQIGHLERFGATSALLGILLFVVLIYTSFVVPERVFHFLRERRLEKMNRQLVEAMNVLALALRSGRNFENALPLVADQIPSPLGAEFERCVREIEVGGATLAQSLQRLAKRVPVKDMEIFVSTVLIVNQVGGSQADILDKNAELIRERFRIKQKIHALTAEGRFSAFSISLAPVFILTINFLMDPETVTEFVTNPIGLLILVAIGVSDYIGYRVLSNMTKIEF